VRQITQDPNWTDVLTALASLVAASGVFFVLYQVREARRSRDAATTADFSRRWDESPVIDSRNTVLKLGTARAVRDELKRLRKAKDPGYSPFLAEPNYYEDLAVLCRRKALDKRMVRDSFGTLISDRYAFWRLAIAELREADDKLDYVHFEDLANEMKATSKFARFRWWLVGKIKP
jgi:hypothetical protein